jgi:Transposase, Mutator family
VKDVFFLVCDGLKGLPEVVGNVWPLTTVQTCIIHRDKAGDLLHQRDRVAERPVPAGNQGPWPFPDRAGGAKVPVPGHPVPRPRRRRPGPVDHAVKPALNAFAITFSDRFPAAETYQPNRRKHR